MPPEVQNPGLFLPILLSTDQSQRQMRASLDSTAQTGHAKGADWQEEIYQICSLDGVHVCHSLARFQWKRVSWDWSKEFYSAMVGIS
ncbi:hypothetical protein NC651_007900 [Populus alba x Populus x berolinensis]|nr:hypothetical protein NC651_007900 [Populus alba x Populus x berolinensis]